MDSLSRLTLCDPVTATSIYGWNIHVWDARPTALAKGRKASIAGQTIFVFASGLAKLSILGSYLRIALPRSTFYFLVMSTIIFVSLAMAGFLGVLWGQCR